MMVALSASSGAASSQSSLTHRHTHTHTHTHARTHARTHTHTDLVHIVVMKETSLAQNRQKVRPDVRRKAEVGHVRAVRVVTVAIRHARETKAEQTGYGVHLHLTAKTDVSTGYIQFVLYIWRIFTYYLCKITCILLIVVSVYCLKPSHSLNMAIDRLRELS